MQSVVRCQCPSHSMQTILSACQSELGDVVYVELPETGSEVTKGETFGVVESVKVGYMDMPTAHL